jgi:hypothetical protein
LQQPDSRRAAALGRGIARLVDIDGATPVRVISGWSGGFFGPAMLATYLPYLLLTVVIEVPIVAVLLRRSWGTARAAVAGTLANVLSHPLLYFGWPRLFARGRGDWVCVITGELLVMGFEAGIYVILGWRCFDSRRAARAVSYDAWTASLLANSVSFGTGLLLGALGWLQPYADFMAHILRVAWP